MYLLTLHSTGYIATFAILQQHLTVVDVFIVLALYV